jgi:hypothetical protein
VIGLSMAALYEDCSVCDVEQLKHSYDRMPKRCVSQLFTTIYFALQNKPYSLHENTGTREHRRQVSMLLKTGNGARQQSFVFRLLPLSLEGHGSDS